jgi:branched-chain amino acid transport system permease protein
MRPKVKLSRPPSLASLPRWGQIVLMILIALFFYALPLLNVPFLTTPDTDFGAVMFTVATYVLAALGLNIVVGYAGLLDLGYVGFYAVGAYTVGVLTTMHADLSWPLVLPIAVLVAVLSGIVLGVPTLRVRGDYLAIVTLGFGEIIRITVVNTDWLGSAGGIAGIKSPPSLPEPPAEPLFEIPHLLWQNGTPLVDLDSKTPFLQFGVLDPIPFYWLALSLVILLIFADILIKNSRVGRSWEATREDEDAAELMGVPTFKFKVLAFAMGAAFGGMSGALFATRQTFISPDSFDILLSMLFLAAVVIGGQGNRWGVILGAALVVYIPERFRFAEDFRFVAFGIALMVLAAFRPEGLLPPRRTLRAKQAKQEIDELEGEGVEVS